MIAPGRVVRTGPLVCFEERPDAGVRLLCVPYAGGGPIVFRDWHAAIGAAEVHAFEPPGRGRRIGEPPPSSIEAAARELEAAVLPLLDRPYAVVGHSMGALIGYELVRALSARGRPPIHFFASGRAAPDVPPFVSGVRALSDDELIRAVEPLGGIPAPVLADAELRALVLPALRADLAACELYAERPGPPLPCAITALAGTDDPVAPPAAAEGWGLRTSAGFRVEQFDGGHFFLETRRADVTQAVRAGIAPDARPSARPERHHEAVLRLVGPGHRQHRPAVDRDASPSGLS